MYCHWILKSASLAAGTAAMLFAVTVIESTVTAETMKLVSAVKETMPVTKGAILAASFKTIVHEPTPLSVIELIKAASGPEAAGVAPVPLTEMFI